jgi:hypothetical protein
MEIAVIIVLGIVAFAFVLYPLFRNGPGGAADAREFEVAPPSPQVPAAAADAEEEAGVGELQPAAPGTAPETDPEDAVAREVSRYRAALRAGTICPRCAQANPAGSHFCFECGSVLAGAEAHAEWS